MSNIATEADAFEAELEAEENQENLNDITGDDLKAFAGFADHGAFPRQFFNNGDTEENEK